MPDLGRDAECIKILLSQASKSMQNTFVPMYYLYFAHISALIQKKETNHIVVHFPLF